MLHQLLLEHYHLQLPASSRVEDDGTFHVNGGTYKLYPIKSLTDKELMEIKDMADFMNSDGFGQYSNLIPTVQNELTLSYEGSRYILCFIPSKIQTRSANPGAYLAKFHQKGSFYPYVPEQRSRVGQWNELWTARLEQLETWSHSIISKNKKTTFDRLFVESFPYYMGLTENAIQYVADCSIDDRVGEYQQGTISHLRFRKNEGEEENLLPFQWVYDHRTRDLAEWIRGHYWKGGNLQEINSFLNYYERGNTLTPMAWRMLYGRLIFPLHYFEVIEGFYTSHSEEEKEQWENRLVSTLEYSHEYEAFLKSFFGSIGLSTQRYGIPYLDWLQNA